MSAARPLSNMQQELLKLYASDIAEADLLNIKRYLAKYFSSRAISDADKIWDEKGFNNDTMDKWLTEDDSSHGQSRDWYLLFLHCLQDLFIIGW